VPESFDLLREFFENGGPVLVAILFVSIILWLLILERYWFFLFGYSEKLDKIVQQWNLRRDQSSWYAMRIREGLLAEVSIAMKENLLPIQALTAILPLMGLLGTVTGMITIFDVLNVFGNGNPRGMAAGISRAMLPTAAGLVTSIAGLYFSSDLDNRARSQTDKARDLLIHH
jgi:biopolymer transport protein ExbB